MLISYAGLVAVMGILPKSRPQIPAADIRAIAEVLALPQITIPRTGRKFGILAIRAYYRDSMGKHGINDRGLNDDAIFLLLDDRVVAFPGNVDASVYRTGIANLKSAVIEPLGKSFVRKPGTGELWLRPGKHKINYPPPRGYAAFRQSRPCTITRDNQGDRMGDFGINLHKGGVFGTSSEGCQTVHPLHWQELRDRICSEFGLSVMQVMANPSGSGYQEFCYLLVDRADCEKILGRTF